MREGWIWLREKGSTRVWTDLGIKYKTLVCMNVYFATFISPFLQIHFLHFVYICKMFTKSKNLYLYYFIYTHQHKNDGGGDGDLKPICFMSRTKCYSRMFNLVFEEFSFVTKKCWIIWILNVIIQCSLLQEEIRVF